jgi:hypothetical protein
LKQSKPNGRTLETKQRLSLGFGGKIRLASNENPFAQRALLASLPFVECDSFRIRTTALHRCFLQHDLLSSIRATLPHQRADMDNRQQEISLTIDEA